MWKILFIILCFISVFVSLNMLVSGVEAANKNMKIQGECIRSYTSQGVERKDIILVGETECKRSY